MNESPTSPAGQSDDKRAAPCPVCGRPRASAHRPFCSRRCADVDLHRWLSGGYAIAGAEDSSADGEERAPPDEDC